MSLDEREAYDALMDQIVEHPVQMLSGEAVLPAAIECMQLLKQATAVAAALGDDGLLKADIQLETASLLGVIAQATGDEARLAEALRVNGEALGALDGRGADALRLKGQAVRADLLAVGQQIGEAIALYEEVIDGLEPHVTVLQRMLDDGGSEAEAAMRMDRRVRADEVLQRCITNREALQSHLDSSTGGGIVAWAVALAVLAGGAALVLFVVPLIAVGLAFLRGQL